MFNINGINVFEKAKSAYKRKIGCKNTLKMGLHESTCSVNTGTTPFCFEAKASGFAKAVGIGGTQGRASTKVVELSQCNLGGTFAKLVGSWHTNMDQPEGSNPETGTYELKNGK